MATVAILGASGYAGQETLDRVLRHPELEVVALGSDSLAGEPASALDVRLNGSLPAFVGERRGARRGCRRRLRLPHATTAPPCSIRRRAPSSSTSPARTGCTTRRSIPRGTASSIRRRRRSATGATRCPSSSRRRGLARSRTPAATRPRRSSRSAPLKDAIDPASVVVDAKSGVSGAGRQLKESSHAGFVLENLSPYKIGAHQHAPEIAQALGFPGLLRPAPAAGAPRAARDVLRAAVGRSRGRCSRTRTRTATSCACCRRASRPSSRASSTPTEPRSASSRIARPSHAIVICALDNLGKGAAGQAMQNANLALGLDETLGLRLAGVLV